MTGFDDLEAHAQRAKAAREALIGKTIAGRYVLRGLLGHGGMGAVYEAEEIGLGTRAAIKFVDPEFATDENVVARFAREARAMSAITSAHIVTVHDAGTEGGQPYLVMELLRGEDLGERLRRTSRVPLGEAIPIVAQVLEGLAAAHAAGIVHRDLKPDNVFLVEHGTEPVLAKIVDFGVSKIERPHAGTRPLALTGRGTVLGTPFYMSPEQAQASPDVDGRTDLYSVGAILFECLTGRPPHTGESYEQIIVSICLREAPDVRSIAPSVPESVSAFVARALARDPAHRFASAEHMLAALRDAAPDERTPASREAPASRDPSASPASTKAVAARPLGVAFAKAAVATLAGVGVTFLAISLLGKQPASSEASFGTRSTSALSSESTTASTLPSAAASGIADAAPSASAHDELAPVSTASAKPGTPSSPRTGPAGTAIPPVPRPSTTKPLDIQRDLP